MQEKEGVDQPAFQKQQKAEGSHRVGVGLDFGTSNSAAAIFDGTTVTMVMLEAQTPVMPTATYLDRELNTCTGQEAIDTYIARNQGRKVELSVEVIGEARMSTGHFDAETRQHVEGDTHAVYGHAFNDGGMPGRLFRGIKRLLGHASSERVEVFGRSFRLVALITPVLLRIRKAIELMLGQPHDSRQGLQACIGHPVNFEGREAGHNVLALQRLHEACGYAGLKLCTFYPEPTAAALSYMQANPAHHGELLLTVDFGGGTLDLCILRRKDDGFDVLAVHGIALGGDLIDQLVFRKFLFPLLGKGERWQRVDDGYVIDSIFPFEQYEELLLNWTVSYMLNQNTYTTPVMDMMRKESAVSGKFSRLYELITQNYSYQVFQAIRNCKAELSSRESAQLDIPEIDITLTITRDAFEECIAEPLERFDEAVRQVMDMAGTTADETSLVLRTGGSSLIPAVKHRLEERFGGRVVEHDPFISVATGLAIADYYNHGVSLDAEPSGSITHVPA